MKIRTQLIVSFVIFALLLVIISGFVITTSQQAEKLADQEELANQIALEIGELGYLSNDYILYREPQQADRWNVKYASISQDIASFSLDQPEQEGIAANLASNLRTSKLIFDDIASSPVQPGGSETVFVQLSWSRMAVQNEGMIFDAGRLAHLLRDQADELRQTRLLLVIVLMGAFVAYLLTGYFLFYRRMLKSLANLQEGATLVGSGDFSHVIDESADDEIGDLARSFNKMTLDLRNITASKSDLEQEMAERKRAEENLAMKNAELNAINEELTATQEELHQNVDELVRREHDLSRALAEKEVLLSEIHHRVKNNLTAFISLLSLEGSTEDTPAGKMLKQDLQNRARSMALIHETLYRTNMYDEVDMGIYLTTLIEQISNSFRTIKAIKTIVNAHGIMLDIPRATPAGLIVNELVTNSFKYAFPDSFDSAAVRNAPPTITVTFERDDGGCRLIVSDNGIGLPAGFDLTKTKTLGLKLVNFLSKHQMRALVEVRADKGTEFIFHMNIEKGTK